MSVVARVILGLRASGWPDKDINDFVLWVETGDEQYLPVGGNQTEMNGEWPDAIMPGKSQHQKGYGL